MVPVGEASELAGKGTYINYQYQKAITIRENSGKTLEDHQVILIFSGSTFPINANADGSDLRFVLAGKELSYWIEEYNPTAKTGKVWLKVPKIPAGGTVTVLMYYGKSYVSPQSNGDKTFDFFDDFSTDKGWITSGVSYTISKGLLDYPGHPGPSCQYIVKKDVPIPDNVVIEASINILSVGQGQNAGIVFSWSSFDESMNDCVTKGYFYLFATTLKRVRLWRQPVNEDMHLFSMDIVAENTNSPVPTDKKLRWQVVKAGKKIEGWIEGTKLVDFTDPTPLPTPGYIGFREGHLQVDFVFARKYTVQEPTVRFSAEPDELMPQEETVANIAINGAYKATSDLISSIESEITEIKSSGVKIPNADALIEQAKSERNKNNFERAEELANEAKITAIVLKTRYYLAFNSISEAESVVGETKNIRGVISSDLLKESEQAFEDGDYERAKKIAEKLKNTVNRRELFCLLEVIAYGVKQEYSLILRLFTYFEIIWFIFWGLCFGSFAVYVVVTGEESIVLWIVVWFVEMGIFCGPVYLIQFLWVEKIRGILEKQQIELQKPIGDYRWDKKKGTYCAVCGKKILPKWILNYKLNKQQVCKECLKKGREEYLRAVIEKWQECPICGSKESFEIKVGLDLVLVVGISKLVCKTCSAEWTLALTLIGGVIKGIYLSNVDSEHRAMRYLLKKHPPEWWAERKWTEEGTDKEEAINKVTETEEEPVEKMKLGKYEWLGKYLNGLKEKEVTLTFEQIEDIFGFQLPSSARQYPAWWANDKYHSHAVNGWLNYGWQTKNPNFSEEIVQFFQINKKAELMPEIPITIERAIYDPCKSDFVEGCFSRMKEWINRYDPGAYWLAVSIQNNTDTTIEEWDVDLECSSALKIKEAKIEGIEIEIPHEAHLGAFKIAVPKEYGIVIPKGGAQRVFFKLRADKPKTTYEISGVFKSEVTGDVLIRAKEFKYLCDAGMSAEAVKAELKKTFSEKDAARLANTFRVVQEIRSSYCNTGTTAKGINKEFDLLKMYLTEKEFLDEIGDIQRRINAELREDERLDEKHIEEVKDFCEKFTEMWIAKFLR